MVNKTLILDKIKSYFLLKGNSELAEFLGVTKQTISNWYARNSIDYDIVISKCTVIDENIDLKWLLTTNTQQQNEKANDDDIARSVSYIEEEYNRNNYLTDSLLKDNNYSDEAELSFKLFQLIHDIYCYAKGYCLINNLQELYTKLKIGDSSMEDIKLQLNNLIIEDRKFYNLISPYKRELRAMCTLILMEDSDENIY